MLIDDVMRQAKNEQEINLLLTAYLEGIQFADKKYFISDTVITLPLGDVNDLHLRFNQLIVDLDGASRALDDHACLAQKEALHIFGTALHRLKSLSRAKPDKKYSPFANSPRPYELNR